MLSATLPEEAQGRAHGSIRSSSMPTAPPADARDPLSIVRRALGAEEQVIRVSDSDTRETYDVTLSRTTPYASPLAIPMHTNEKGEKVPPPPVLTPPPTRRRRLRWMRSSEDTRTAGAGTDTPPRDGNRVGVHGRGWSHAHTGSPGMPNSSESGGLVASPGPTSSPGLSFSGASPSPSPGPPDDSTATSTPTAATTHTGTTSAAHTAVTAPLASESAVRRAPTLNIPATISHVASTFAQPPPQDMGTESTAPSLAGHLGHSPLGIHTPLPPLSNIHQMLGQSRSDRDVHNVPDVRVSPAPMSKLTASTPQVHSTSDPNGALSTSPTERTFDEEMAENADALRRSLRAKEHQHHSPHGTQCTELPVALKGNLIGEDHVNYVLMYHMLTGIRIAVSRNESRPCATLSPADFTAKYKFTFDIIGNELRPSSNYDFKFKDYAPAVFRELRRHFGLDAGDYLLSLAARYILTELGSPGKSGSFFYFSHDYRFIIKTIRPGEHKLFVKFLPAYYDHVCKNPFTLLSQFYGLHRVKLPGHKKIHFVIMNNLFPSHRDVHELYDLKGSTISREQTSSKPSAVLKDMNWLMRNRYIELGPTKRELFAKQLRSDVRLLERYQLMDYSLLIGLHDLTYSSERGSATASSPIDKSVPMLRRPSVLVSPVDGHSDKPNSPILRTERDAASSDGGCGPLQFSRNHPLETSLQTMQGKRAEHQHSPFYQDEGGMRATDEHDNVLGIVYYFGIIDLFTRYDTRKRAEHLWKGIWHNRHAISPVPPVEYGERFIRFLLRQKKKPSDETSASK